MSVRNAIINEIVGLAEQQKTALTAFDETSPLDGVGLDSDRLATLVARLDEIFDIDPFDSVDDVPPPATVGDLIGIYERVLT
jgi:hypothetical protein